MIQSERKTIVITGSSGFVGLALCRTLLKKGYKIRAIVRNEESAQRIKTYNPEFLDFLECYIAEDLILAANSPRFFNGAEIFIHLASRTHVQHETCENPLAEYRKINVDLTRHLAEGAALAGIKRFIYLSSIKVNGEKSLRFTEKDTPNPEDAYGITKWEAELALQEIAKKTNLKIVILRPPLIYGKGVKANFEALIKAVKSKKPLPLASIKNLRSLLYIENLCDLISLCIEHPNAINQTFVVSDGSPVSTPELIRALSEALNTPVKLWKFPINWLMILGWLTRRQGSISRLTNSLVIDDTKVREDLNWNPPFSMREAFMRDFSEPSI